MNSQFLHELAHAAEAHGVYAEDFADRLSSKYTSMGLLLLAAVSVMRQYVFKPLQCWVPVEWPKPWEEFVESYCWTQGTYRVSMQEAAHPEVQTRGELAINYYQWVPILLTAQAILVMGPRQLWIMASLYLSGRDPHSVVRFAHEMERAVEPETKQRLVAYAAWQLELRMPPRSEAAPEQHHRPRACSEAMRQSGWVLFGVYLASKVAHLLSAIGQVLLLKSYLGLSSPLFGWHCARNLLSGGQWQQTGVFPRVTFCDVPIRHVGQWNVRSIQCVLASNMVNEKIFIALWFWFAFCCLVTTAYTVCWMLELLPASGRNRVVKGNLRLLSTHRHHRHNPRESPDDSGGEVYDLVRRLRPDGVFLLQMIADNVDSLCAAQILGHLLLLQAESDDAGSAESSSPRLAARLPLLRSAATTCGSAGDGSGPQLRLPFGPTSKV